MQWKKSQKRSLVTASCFELGTINSSSGYEGTNPSGDTATNRARTEQLECTNEYPISVTCDSSVKWLVHFFRNGTWFEKTTFASTNADNVATLCSTPTDVTHVRILIAYTSDTNITNIEDLVSHFTITRTVKGEGGMNIDLIVEAVLNRLPVYNGEVVE